MVKFQVSLNNPEFKALRTLANNEFRDHRTQAALIIRDELMRRGLILEQPSQQLTPATEGGKNAS